MDRSGSQSTTPVVSFEEGSTVGWDPDSVWRQRVRRTRLSDDGSGPRMVVETVSVGWDPHETWRLRVQAPRRTPR